VQQGRVVAFGVGEAFEGRQLHAVGVDRVEGPFAAVADVGSAVAAKRSATAMRSGAGRGGTCVEMLGQAVDLLDAKHRVALHEGDFALDLVAVVGGLDLETASCSFRA